MMNSKMSLAIVVGLSLFATQAMALPDGGSSSSDATVVSDTVVPAASDATSTSDGGAASGDSISSGDAQPGCGNGKCEGDEKKTCPSDCGAPKGSCKGKCGQFTSGATCQCDTQCKTYKDCCPDYDKVCP
mgnify:CR=1 FL=1